MSHYSIRAFNNQQSSMDRLAEPAVYSHLIKPFLSRNDQSGIALYTEKLLFLRWDVVLTKMSFLIVSLQIPVASRLPPTADAGCRTTLEASPDLHRCRICKISIQAFLLLVKSAEKEAAVSEKMFPCVYAFYSLIKQWSPFHRGRHWLCWPLLR